MSENSKIAKGMGTGMKTAKRFLFLAVVIALMLMLVGCGKTKNGAVEDGDSSSKSLTIEGSDTMVNLAQAWAEEFMNENPGIVVTVKGGGSGAGIASLLNGTTDFANASRKVKDEEFEQGKTNNVDVKENAVARDGIAIMVNKSNKVTALSVDELGKIYRGEITNWKAVGGDDAAIVLLGRDTSSGTYEFFQENVVGKENEYSKEMRNLQSNQAIVEELKGNPNAIGYVGMGYENSALSLVEIDGVSATVDAVKDGSYALSRLLYMDSDGIAAGLKKTFLEWVLSSAGQKIVEDEGFVAL